MRSIAPREFKKQHRVHHQPAGFLLRVYARNFEAFAHSGPPSLYALCGKSATAFEVSPAAR